MYSDDSDASSSKLPENAHTTPNIPDTAPDSSTSIIPKLIEGDKLIYCYDGYGESATLQKITCSDSSFNYLIKPPNETVITIIRELLRPTGEHENITLPSTLDDYKDIIKDLTVEHIENIMHPKALSRLE